MASTKDHSTEVIRIMDESGLNPGTFLNAKKSMSRIVVEVRTKLYTEFMAYLKRLEEEDGEQ